MWLLLKEYGLLNTDELNFTFGSCEAERNILTGFKNVADAILAFVDGSHVDGVFVDNAEHADEDHTVGHDMPQVIALGVNREALTYILIVRQHIVEKPCDCVSLFELKRVLGTLDEARSGGSLTISVLSEDLPLFLLDLQHHLEVLVPVDDAVGVGVVFAEKRLDFFVCHVGAAHILEEGFEFALLDLAVAGLVEVLETSNDSNLLFRCHQPPIGVGDLVVLSVDHKISFV
jgi:hypothetical protein